MEHYCKDCKNDGDNTCQFTGAVHTTGIECPSFDKKEEVEMFKVGDKVRVVADEERLTTICLEGRKYTGKCGVIDEYNEGKPLLYRVVIEGNDNTRNLAAQDLELVETVESTEAGHTARTFIGHPEGVLEETEPRLAEYVAKAQSTTANSIRTFESGATRDTDQGKLDYVKALSPIVLRRYVQYLDKHRLQSNGSYRSFDNWKQGIPEEAYISGGGRHFIDTWLLTEGYATEDNHGPVEIEDALCAQLFNLMGRLHEMLKDKELKALPSRTSTTPGGF